MALPLLPSVPLVPFPMDMIRIYLALTTQPSRKLPTRMVRMLAKFSSGSLFKEDMPLFQSL
jgi:hypothetical protein